MDISIIIVNYKSIAKTLDCIAAIKQSRLDGVSLEIIVVDNNSGDQLELISYKYPEAKIVASGKNIGMGGGNNLGIDQCFGEFILILNPDTRVEPNLISELYHYIKPRSEIGVLGPKLLNPDHTLQYSCLRFPKFYTPFLRRTFLDKLCLRHLDDFLMKDFDHQQVREVDWMIGSCLMLRRSALDKIGKAFDEKFFMYFEDTDLCRRLKRANFKVVYYPLVSAIHDHKRQSANYPWYIAPFINRLAREHLKSWFKYFLTD